MVLLIGDPAQLPPVKGVKVWNKTVKQGDEEGYQLYGLFDIVNKLEQIEQVNKYEGYLRDGDNTEDD